MPRCPSSLGWVLTSPLAGLARYIMRSMGSNYVYFEYLGFSWLAMHAGTMAKMYHITVRSNIICRPRAIPGASAAPALGS
eukprot:320788-Pyramimonas_sp.AAC.1